MFRHTAIWMTLVAAVALAGCSSRRGDRLSENDYPYAGPPAESGSDAGRHSTSSSPPSGQRYASAYDRSGREPGGTGYYGRWAYASGRDPSYDYYLASYDDYGDDYEDEYGYPEVVGYFYDELDPYGTWQDDPRYGWVWYPEYVSAGWRPYLYGHWVYTDWGWAWVSDDPWGADPYHYGRWACDASNRWMWVPDDVWAPAWVSWRYGGGYAGWAPLPPEATWDFSFGIRYADDFVAPTRWCFVPDDYITSTRLRTYVAPLRDTRRIYSRTRDLTRYAVVNGRVADRGLQPALIERATGRDIPTYRLETRERGLRRDMVRGRTLVSPMPVVSRGGRGRGGAERLTSEMRTRRDRFEREMRTRGGRLEQGQRPRGRVEEPQARGRNSFGRERAVERNHADQQQRFERQQQQRLERQQQQRYERDRSDQRRRDRAEIESRARDEQARRDEARQRADRAQYQREQARQRAEQARYDRQQRYEQQQQARQQAREQTRARQEERRQQVEQARYERQQRDQQLRDQQQEQHQQQQRQQQQRQQRQDRGDGGGQQQGSDERGHGRGHGHNR